MGMFFVSWALWEEMTFVLAGAIVVVFFIGLFKLWRTSRQLRRQELIDEEKRARRVDLRRVVRGGSKAGRGNSGGDHTARKKNRHGSEIPFGIRAMQSGVQVEGIWIIHPATPAEQSPLLHQGEQQQQQQQQQQQETTAYIPVATTPREDRRDAVLDPTSPTSPIMSMMPLPKISEDGMLPILSTSKLGQGSSSGTNGLNEDTLRQLEGAYWPTPQNSSNTHAQLVETYIPSHAQRSSAGPRSGPSPSPILRSHQSSGSGSGSGSNSLCHSPGLAQTLVFGVADCNSNSNSNSHCSQLSAAAAGKHSRTISQGSCSNNSSSRDNTGVQQQRPRVVNSAFEVLPAGTFGPAAVASPAAADTQEPPMAKKRSSFFAPPKNKLRRASKPGSHKNEKKK